MQPLPLTNLVAPHLSTERLVTLKKSPPHASLFSWRRATAGTITSCDQVRMGSTIGVDPLILGSPSFVASGMSGLWGRLLLSETDGLQILTEYVEVAYVPLREETWFWDTLLRTFYTLWYWFFTTMVLCYHLHPFCANLPSTVKPKYSIP